MSIDGDSSSLQRDVTDVSEARKRRNRSTRRPRSADVRSSTTEHQQWEEGVRSTSRLDEGGEEDSMHSGSVTSTSARYRRSLKRSEKKRQGQGLAAQVVQGGDIGSGVIHPLLSNEGGGAVGEEETGQLEDEEEDGKTVATERGEGLIEESNVHSLDDTTERITSLLRRIEGEQETVEDHRGNTPHPTPNCPSPLQPTLALTVHRTDRLKSDLTITHPLVRVCLVNSESGELVKKSYPGRCVTSYYEDGVDCILPVLTQPWRKIGCSLHPQWEETLVFNEDINLFTSHPNLLFFEILDFPSSHHQHPMKKRQEVQSESWYKIAWAFLKAGGDNMSQRNEGGAEEEEGEEQNVREREEGMKRNVGKVCRLQLYKYLKNHHRASSNTTQLLEMWHSNKRKPYPSTLYVTLNEATPTLPKTTPTTRSLDPSQPEVGRESVDQMMSRLHSNHTVHSRIQSGLKLLDVPNRLPGHTCHLPTSLHSHLHPSHHVTGCSTLSFSPNGRYLGAGCTGHGNKYILVIYEVSTLSVALYLEDAHRGFIYSVSWSHDSHMISTASADGLVKVWSIVCGSGDEVTSIPHPCYVYATCFIPPSPILTPNPQPSTHTSHYVIFTGTYDKIVRVWTLTPSRIQLTQELRGHRGHVNTICTDSSGEMVLSGDSVGDVMVWSRVGGEQHIWHLQRTLSGHKSSGPILSLCLHTGGRRLLVHTSNGRLAMIDLRV